MYIPSPGAGGGGGGEGAGEGGEEIQKLLSQLALIKQAALELCLLRVGTKFDCVRIFAKINFVLQRKCQN